MITAIVTHAEPERAYCDLCDHAHRACCCERVQVWCSVCAPISVNVPDLRSVTLAAVTAPIRALVAELAAEGAS